MKRFTAQTPVVRTAKTASTTKAARATHRADRATHHAAMLQAAKNTLDLGVNNGINIKIFGAPYKTKVGRKGTNGSCDAVGKFDDKGNDQTGLALSPWTGKYLAANPCIRLDYSGLVAIDVDHGFEGLTDEEMVAKGEANGLPRTYTVRTGRANGGATFFYRGRRTLKDCSGLSGFKVGELSGDIKHHGHVAAAGSLHKSGRTYKCINDIAFAPLPEFWRDYKHTKKAKPGPAVAIEATELLSPFEQDCLRRAEGTDSLSQSLKKAHEYMLRQRERLLNGELVAVKHGELIPQGRRLKYLTRQAGIMRKQGLDPEIIRIALDIRALRKCEDGEKFIVTHKTNLDTVAGWSAEWEEGDVLVLKLNDVVISTFRKPRRLKRQELIAEAVKKLPASITAAKGYDSLERELDGTGFTINRKNARHRRLVAAALKKAGFEVRNMGGRWEWAKDST